MSAGLNRTLQLCLLGIVRLADARYVSLHGSPWLNVKWRQVHANDVSSNLVETGSDLKYIKWALSNYPQMFFKTLAVKLLKKS